jgi:hypothetical protein
MVGGGPFGLDKGQWTDDTSMALCLADSLITCATFDANDQDVLRSNDMKCGTSIMSTFRERFFYPLIQTQAGCFGSRDNIGMQVGRNPDIEFSGEAFVRGNPTFLTGLQVNLERRSAFPQQTLYISSIKVCASGKTQEFAAEHANVGVKSDNSFMSINLHYVFHGFTPCSSNE